MTAPAPPDSPRPTDTTTEASSAAPSVQDANTAKPSERHRGRHGAGRRSGHSTQRTQDGAAASAPAQHPVLGQLATLCPVLFAEPLKPLKRGIYEDLLAAFPDALEAETLKTALAQHARSSRYLTVIASGLPRHDLNGQPVEALTPEQVHHALIQVFRRRGARSAVDLRPKLRQRILKAYEATGLSPDAYLQRVHGKDEEVNQLTRDALAEASARAAREDAMLRAFETSGKDVKAFAEMYGLHILDAHRSLERARARQTPPVATAAQAD